MFDLMKPVRSLALFAICLTIFAASASAQTVDRAALLQEMLALKGQLVFATDPAVIKSLTAEITAKEKLFLAPAPQDLAQSASFLQQPYTGILRLMPREKFDGTLNLRGGGAYYSFASLYQAYGYGSDLSLEQNRFGVGFAGADFGMILLMNNQTIDSITLQTPGVNYLATFTPPLDEPGARLQQRRTSAGFTESGFNYSDLAPVVLGRTYVVRSVGYGRADVLVAFEPFRNDVDGSLLIRWKMLKRFPAPQLNGSTIATTSAASYAHTSYAPGSIVSLFGSALTDQNYVATSLPLPQFFGTTQVNVQDPNLNRRASLFAGTPGQINFLIPPDTAEGYALISVRTSSGLSHTELVNISKTAPGLFSANADGQGVAAAVALRINGNQQSYEAVARFDSAQNKFVAVPLEVGSNNEQLALVLFGTGVRGRNSLDEVSVKIGGVSVPVLYAGAQGSEGLDQINALIPRELAGSSEVDVVLSVNGKPANTVRINIK